MNILPGYVHLIFSVRALGLVMHWDFQKRKLLASKASSLCRNSLILWDLESKKILALEASLRRWVMEILVSMVHKVVQDLLLLNWCKLSFLGRKWNTKAFRVGAKFTLKPSIAAIIDSLCLLWVGPSPLSRRYLIPWTTNSSNFVAYIIVVKLRVIY